MSLPRVGFVGTGWIGRDRMAAICRTGAVEVSAIAEPDSECLEQARALAPAARIVSSLDEMLGLGLDGIVIATPSALHAAQSIAGLRSGAAVFCQKPLGRSAGEVRDVIAAAREADRLLSVDFSYRYTAAARAMKRLIADGTLGTIYAADLVFHNAYGPDKPWFYDRAQSGGGCVMDLGVHLIDLLLWMLDFPEVEDVRSRLHAGGSLLGSSPDEIENYASAEIGLAGGASARLTCSWHLHAGQDAVIEAAFYGTEGGAALRNVAGSFYDFEGLHWRGTSREVLTMPPDSWGGRAAADWAERLASDPRFHPEATRIADVAEVIERIYQGNSPAVPKTRGGGIGASTRIASATSTADKGA